MTGYVGNLECPDTESTFVRLPGFSGRSLGGTRLRVDKRERSGCARLNLMALDRNFMM
ncbi:MAG: hypothetical protein A4E65_02548 [Syntrophorhabdus sp. PtaU1.Bin153]|nr:MAG: hypothetical protein A4E65_02548 [Syntrophorhabdus sp. PtaU1.Bin153]